MLQRDEQTNVGRSMEDKTNCNEQQQDQQQEQQQCRTSGIEPLSDRLIQQGLPPTQIGGMCASMLMTVQRWNFPLPRVSCCPLHASVKPLRLIVERMELLQCRHDFAPTGPGQCHQCGVMFHPDFQSCDICCSTNAGSLEPIQEGVEEPIHQGVEQVAL